MLDSLGDLLLNGSRDLRVADGVGSVGTGNIVGGYVLGGHVEFVV